MLPPDNFQEDAVAGPRPAHLADQSRPLSPVDCERARFRLDWRARHDRAARGDDGDHGEARAISRPFLQLVRYGKPTRPRSAICLVGRQRQSRRTSHRARQCLPGLVRDAARRCEAARRNHRCAQPRSGRGRSAAGPPPHRNRHLAPARRVRRASLRGSRPAYGLDGETLAGRLAALAAPAEILVDLARGIRDRAGRGRFGHPLLGAGGLRRPSPATSATSPRSDDLATRLSAIGRSGAGNGPGDGVRLPPERGAPAPFRRLRGSRRRARRKLLRPAGLGSAPCELHRHRQGRPAGRGTGSGLDMASPRRPRRRGPAVLVRLDVRISDARR